MNHFIELDKDENDDDAERLLEKGKKKINQKRMRMKKGKRDILKRQCSKRKRQ